MSDALNRSIDLHTCRQHHVVLRFIIDDLPHEEPLDAVATTTLLRRFRDVLTRHLKLEDASLYPALCASSDAHIRATAHRYKDEMGGLYDVFEAFYSRWPNAQAIRRDPSTFLKDWQQMREQLVKRMDAEDLGLYDPAESHFNALLLRSTFK